MSSDFDCFIIKKEFTVYDAANAILGITKPDKENEYRTKLVCKELVCSIQNGTLATIKRVLKGSNYFVRDGLGGHYEEELGSISEYYTTIAREDLAAWCEKRNYRPAFLFPDPPTDKHLPVDKPLHENERKTLLSIIRALAILHKVKPLPTGRGDGWHKAAECLLKELSSIDDPPSDAKTLAKHLRAAFSNDDS